MKEPLPDRSFWILKEYTFPWERNLEIPFKEGNIEEIKATIPVMLDLLLRNDLELKEKNNISFRLHPQHKSDLEPDFLDSINRSIKLKYLDRHVEVKFIYSEDLTLPIVEMKFIKNDGRSDN